MRAMNNISNLLLEGNFTLRVKELISLLVEVLKMVLRIIPNVKPEFAVEEEPEEKHATVNSSKISVSQQDDKYSEISKYFPSNVRPKEIIDLLIELGNAKQFNGTFIIRFDTEWYVTFKILHCRGKVICNVQRFSEIVRHYVVPHIKDERHRKRISCNYKNLKVINMQHPYRKLTCAEWKLKLRENPTNLALRRAVRLYNYLVPKLLPNSGNV